MISDDAFQAYQEATGATMDQATGLLKLTDQQLKNLQSLNYKIGDVSKHTFLCNHAYSVFNLQTTFELTPNAQIWPRSLNNALGGDADSNYAVFASMGQISGIGLDFISTYRSFLGLNLADMVTLQTGLPGFNASTRSTTLLTSELESPTPRTPTPKPTRGPYKWSQLYLVKSEKLPQLYIIVLFVPGIVFGGFHFARRQMHRKSTSQLLQ